MINVAICDDDIKLCGKLENILESEELYKYFDININVFYCAEDLIKHIKNGNLFHIIFLDIEMGEVSGIQAGNAIKSLFANQMVQIIFISNHKEYALELFDIRPFNFMIKPLDEEKVKKEFREAIKTVCDEEKVFRYKSHSKWHHIKISKIIYFECKGRKVNIVTTDGDFEFYSKMEDVQMNLDKNKFALIHRSFLINLKHITSFDYNSITLSNNETLDISQKRRKETRELLMKMHMKAEV